MQFFLACLLCLAVPSSKALTTQQSSSRSGRSRPTAQKAILDSRATQTSSSQTRDDADCDPCKLLEEEDLDMDRREALFSLMGMAWAAGALPAALVAPEFAHAAYGADAKIELPNPVQSMSDRATKQCLVESLGTRECLVYADLENRLYQGADGKRLLTRLEKASASLEEVPRLLEAKKWSQVIGVLTGPMGELIGTMNQLVELTENKSAAKSQVKNVKTDLYAIAAAVGRKQADVALQSYQAATGHLVDFVKSLD